MDLGGESFRLPYVFFQITQERMEIFQLNLAIARLETFGHLSNFEYVPIFRGGRAEN